MARLDYFLSHLVAQGGDHLLLEAGQPFSLVANGSLTPLMNARPGGMQNENIVALLEDVADAESLHKMRAGDATAFFYSSPHGLFRVDFKSVASSFCARITPSTASEAVTAPVLTAPTPAPIPAPAAASSHEVDVNLALLHQLAHGTIRPAANLAPATAATRSAGLELGPLGPVGPVGVAAGGATPTQGTPMPNVGSGRFQVPSAGGATPTNSTPAPNLSGTGRFQPPTIRPAAGSAVGSAAAAAALEQEAKPPSPTERFDGFIADLFASNAEHLILESGATIYLVNHGRPQPAKGVRNVLLTDLDVQNILAPAASEHGRQKINLGQSTSFDYAMSAGEVLVELQSQPGGRLIARVTPLRIARERGVAGKPIHSLMSQVVPTKGEKGDRPALERWFEKLIERGASDLHMSGGLCPMVRLDGEIVALSQLGIPTPEQLEAMLREIMDTSSLMELDDGVDVDFAYAMGNNRLRIHVMRERNGVGAVVHAIPPVRTAAALRLPPSIMELCAFQKGLVLVTGPTGSGKSTTLAAMIDWINENRTGHILTIEDPIEFLHEQKRCLVRQREVGDHTPSFSHALRAGLREDPDFILVGEMRDVETVTAALESAETGHLVFATLHTNSASAAIDRIIDLFPGDKQQQVRTQLSEILLGVVAQVLCKKKEGAGRVPAIEVLRMTTAVSSMIRERKVHQLESVMQTSKGAGMSTLHDSLFELVKKDEITPTEAYLRALDKTAIKTALVAAGHKNIGDVGKA